MKKRLITIISFLIAVLLGFSSMGCNLVTTDTEKDMKQIVATVCIDKDGGAPVEEIEKQEMIISYLNYGYYYVQANGWTNEQVFTYILNTLVQNRIIIQNAMKDIDEGNAPFTNYYKDETIEKWNIERYLTKFDGIDADTNLISDINEAKYQAIKSMNEMIEGYIDEEESNKVGDGLTEEVRTVPTDASNVEDEVTEQDKLDVIADGVKKGELGSKEIKAYNKVLKMLETNALLGDDFDGEDVTTTDYYKNLLKTSQENVLLNKYQKAVNLSNRSKITYEMLEEKYAEMYAQQQESYNLSRTDFAAALESVSADNPVLYNPYGGYGYVYNLLIGVDDIQEAKISALEGTDAEKQEARREILENTIIKDLRSTWILSGYDFDYSTKKFTGDYTFLEDAKYSLPFEGEVTLLNPDREEDEDAEYRIESVKEFGVKSFLEYVNEYVYLDSSEVKPLEKGDAGWASWKYYVYQNSTKPENFDDKINELLFAYSTDSGSLNKYKGYLVSPAPGLTENETYMQEFADAGRELLGLGGSSYVVAATDYGYHIMFYSEIVSAQTGYDNLTDYLIAQGISNPKETYNEMVNGWDDYEDTDSYLYKLMNVYSSSYVSNALSEKTQAIVDTFYNSTCVTKYTNAYQDLLK